MNLGSIGATQQFRKTISISKISGTIIAFKYTVFFRAHGGFARFCYPIET
jgi:hypothetical protein